MKLIGLKIDKNPLLVEFMWEPDRKRNEDFAYQELYNNLYFTIDNPAKISEIMDYFTNKCDEGISPQSLCEYNGIGYRTLMNDYEENSNFDDVLDHMTEILDISLSDEDKEYITCIDVSYPETWVIQILQD